MMLSATQALDMAEYIRADQALHWHRLEDAINRAINRVWSQEAGNEAQTIAYAATLAGITEHGDVPWPLVAGGVYRAVLEAGKVDNWLAALPAPEKLIELDALMRRTAYHRPLLKYQSDYAATVAAIRSPRETAWIRNDGSDW